MILQADTNMAVSAPEFSDTGAILNAYRTWKGNNQASAVELYNFMTEPSNQRNAFLSRFARQVTAVNNLYVRQRYF